MPVKTIVGGIVLLVLRASLANGQETSPGDEKRLAELLQQSSGNFVVPAGKYLFNGTLEIDLTKQKATSLRADGPVTITMAAAGPAIRIIGSVQGTASPNDFSPETWLERMPLIDGIEILGAHDQADGIELNGTMQATIARVTVRRARHGIHLVNRNRNVIISDVHLYHNTGIGLFLDDVNLHQINVGNSHISYNREGGIVVRGGNVRNLHVTGCDIEANMPGDGTPTKAANILIDQSADDDRSIAEVAITGCTIQHSAAYSQFHKAPGGANIRILGNDRHQPNMIAITGNVLSDTGTHVHLNRVADVTLTGNTFFTTEPTDLQVENSQRVIVSACAFNPRESKETGQIIFRDCTHCLLIGLTLHNLRASEAAISLERCTTCRVSQLLVSGAKNGIRLTGSRGCTVSDCTFTGLGASGRALIDAGTETSFHGITESPE